MSLSIDKKQFFPTQLLAFRNDLNSKKLNRKIANYVIEQSKKNPNTKRYSVGGETGWHSECNLHDLPYDWSQELRMMILGASSAFVGIDIDIITNIMILHSLGRVYFSYVLLFF